jgi:hypothetical protein
MKDKLHNRIYILMENSVMETMTISHSLEQYDHYIEF